MNMEIPYELTEESKQAELKQYYIEEIQWLKATGKTCEVTKEIASYYGVDWDSVNP